MRDRQPPSTVRPDGAACVAVELKSDAKRLLCVAVASPERSHDGDAIRVLGLLKSLSSTYETHFVSSAPPECLARAQEAIEQLTGGTAEVFPQRRRRPFPSVDSTCLWARALATVSPAPTLAHRDPLIARYLRRAAHLYDGVVLLDNAVAVYMPELRRARAVVIDVHNVAGWSLALTATDGMADRVKRSVRVRLMRAWERRTLGQATAITVTSIDEAERMRVLYGLEAQAVVPSGSVFPDAPVRGRGSGVVGWLGGLGYAPNSDGLLCFLQEGWAALGAAGHRLLVAGRGASEAVRAWDGVGGVSVVGFVDDLDAFLERVDVAVVPLWAGAGVKLKTVTFLGAGVPVVTTPVGAEGTGIRDGEHASVAETPEGLGAALARLLAHPEEADRLARSGRELALAHLTWEACGATFVAAVEQALCRGSARGGSARPGVTDRPFGRRRRQGRATRPLRPADPR